MSPCKRSLKIGRLLASAKTLLCTHDIFILVFIAFTIRLILLPFTGDDHDTWIWHKIGRSIVDLHMNPYDYNLINPKLATDPYSYPIPWALFCALAYYLYTFYPTTEAMLFFQKLPLAIADVAIGILVGRLTYLFTGKVKLERVAMALYLFNPYAVFVSSIYNQFDSLPSLFCMLALFFFLKGRKDLSALSLGVAIAFKEYPVILLPTFLIFEQNWKRRIRYLLFGLTPIIILSIPFLALNYQSYLYAFTFQHTWAGNFTYWALIYSFFGVPRYRGEELLPQQIAWVNDAFVLIVMVCLYLFLSRSQKEVSHGLPKSLLATILVFFSSYRFIQNNHPIWGIPFSIIDGVTRNRRFGLFWWNLPLFIYLSLYWWYFLYPRPDFLVELFKYGIWHDLRGIVACVIFPIFTIAYFITLFGRGYFKFPSPNFPDKLAK
jgi:hypothetical protein